MNFFITGLPRSGSAWIANYLSYGNCMCLHDTWINNTPSDIKELFSSLGYYAAGTSDPANVMLYDKINKEFPDAKWVIITRAQKDVEESCKNLNWPITEFSSNFQKLTQDKNPLKVSFTKLFDKADEIGRYIYEDWECPKWRKDLLKKLNVQLHWGKVSEQFKVPEVLLQADVMTPAKMEFIKLLKEIVNNDPNAVRFVIQVQAASELYKRLDKGRPVDIQLAKETLSNMATEWLISPFVRNFSASLAPSIARAIESYTNNNPVNCPIDIDLITTVTYIFRGNDGVKEFMPRVRELSDKILKERQ